MRVERLSTGERFTLLPEDTLGAGGEARIFVVPSMSPLVAKFYHKANPTHEKKLQAMLSAPPADPMAEQNHISIAWPLDILHLSYGRGFVGYVMPKVSGMHSLFHVFNPSTRRKHLPLFNYRYLLRTARNLSLAVHALHERGYVIGDVNESNILVHPQAVVTLVDTDSFQVNTEKTTFRCTVGKPEYTPPELQGLRFAEHNRTTEHDRFGLAVLLFQMLMEGTHPFAGVYTGVGEPPPYELRIEAGTFAYGGRKVPYHPMPHAPDFSILPPALRALFLQCFEAGHHQPSLRPTPKLWQAALAEAEEQLSVCAQNPQHYFADHLSVCPWCLRTIQLGGRDPFPIAPVPDEPPPRRSRSVSISSTTSISNASPSPSISSTQTTSVASPYYTSVSPPSHSSGVQLIQRIENVWIAIAFGWAGIALLALPLRLTGLTLLCGIAGIMTSLLVWKFKFCKAKHTPQLCRVAGGLSLVALCIRPLVMPTGAERHILTARSGGIRSLDFAPDGKTLACGTERKQGNIHNGGRVDVWDVESETYKQTLAEYSGNVVSVDYSKDGSKLVVGHDSAMGGSEVLIISSRIRGNQKNLLPRINSVQQATYLNDGQSIAALTNQRNTLLWNANEWLPNRTFTERYQPLTIAASPTSPQIAVGCAPRKTDTGLGAITVWNYQLSKANWVRVTNSGSIVALAFSPTGKILAAGSSNGDLRLWNASNGSLILRLPQVYLHTTAVKFSPEGKYLISAGIRRGNSGDSEFDFTVWEVASGVALRRTLGHSAPINALAFSPDGKLFVSGCEKGIIRIWKTAEILPHPKQLDSQK